ncbi:putative RNA-directed DNA polymerase from transposon X-element [Trichonephila clavipes]|nr:putative RNA-directed DNA polymerase from transposon X-element [Trichonephila clavipes]
MKRLYDARPSNIRPFMDRMKLHISELDLPNVPPVVFQRVFAYHRSQYSRYSAIYTDGSKRADYVGCGVVIEDIMHGYRLDTSCSIFTAEAVAIYRALQLIDSTMPRKYCIYTDSMSVLTKRLKTTTIAAIQWCCQTPLGGGSTIITRVYQAIVLSRIDYGCVAYGSACNSTLQKLDPVHHMALRICSGAFRTSPVQSLYVYCHQLPLDLRRRKLSLAFILRSCPCLHILCRMCI